MKAYDPTVHCMCPLLFHLFLTGERNWSKLKTHHRLVCLKIGGYCQFPPSPNGFLTWSSKHPTQTENIGSWPHNLQPQSFSQGATNWSWEQYEQSSWQATHTSLEVVRQRQSYGSIDSFLWTSWSRWTHKNPGAWSLDLERKFKPFKKPSCTKRTEWNWFRSDVGLKIWHHLARSSVPLGKVHFTICT